MIKALLLILLLFFTFCKTTEDRKPKDIDAIVNYEEFKIREAILLNDKDELEKWCILYLEKKESEKIYSILANLYKERSNYHYAEYYAGLALDKVKSIDNYLLLISILNARGKYKEMIVHYEELILLDNQFEFLYNLSELYFYLKDYIPNAKKNYSYSKVIVQRN